MGRFPIHPSQPRRADSQHESKCRRCGISCHLALPINGTLVEIPGLHCQFLKPAADRAWVCSVYEDRFERAPWCHHADEALPLGFLARDCPYVVEAGVKRGKVRLREPLVTQMWPVLLQGVMAEGVPPHVDRAAFLAEVARREGRRYELIETDRADNRLQLRPADLQEHADPANQTGER